MGTFKLTLTQEITEEVEFAVPSYRMCDFHTFMIISDTECIQVYFSSDSTKASGISTENIRNAFILKGDWCTEYEFFEKANQVINAIHSKIQLNTIK